METKISNSSIKSSQKLNSFVGRYSVENNHNRIRFFLDKESGRVKAIGKIPNITNNLEEIEREDENNW